MREDIYFDVFTCPFHRQLQQKKGLPGSAKVEFKKIIFLNLSEWERPIGRNKQVYGPVSSVASHVFIGLGIQRLQFEYFKFLNGNEQKEMDLIRE